MDFDYPRTRNYGGSQPEGEIHPPLSAKDELLTRSSYRLGTVEANLRHAEQRLGNTQTELAETKKALDNEKYWRKSAEERATRYYDDLELAYKKLKRLQPKKVTKKKASK